MEQLNQILQKSKESQIPQKKAKLTMKQQKLTKLSELIDQNSYKYAQLISQEMGKPIKQSLAEVKKSAAHCRYYAENLEKLIQTQRVKTEAHKTNIILEPIGTIFLIMPFNFPFWLPFKSAIPNLALGNSIILRPSDSTPLTGLALQELFFEAGYQQNEFLNVFSSQDQTEYIIQNCQGVSFTGSTNAGRKIAELAGRNLKKCVMELGGSDPFIVLQDADVKQAAQTAVLSRFLNAGQVCIAAKRFIVHEDCYDQFIAESIEEIKKLKLGDQQDENTTMGPLARKDLLDSIQNQVQKGIDNGAELVIGGDINKDFKDGNFFNPTLLKVQPDNILFNEEVFGPIMCVTKFQNDQQAIDIANSSKFGLGSSIFSKNIEKAQELAQQIQSGSVFINSIVKSDSRLPSGGVKDSGFGRECGQQGFEEFANIKTLWVDK